MSDRPSNIADAVFKIEGVSAEIKVVSVDGHEAISDLFRFVVEIAVIGEKLDLAAQVGQPAALEITAAAGKRWVNGVVRAIILTDAGTNIDHYAVELVPLHWQLTRRHCCRIFQEMSATDVVKKVLEAAGLASGDHFRVACQETHDVREYIVQYRESDYAFISRLLEDEGAYFFFEQLEDKHVMVIADNSSAHTPVTAGAEVPFRKPTGMLSEAERETIASVRDRHEMQIGAVRLTDFNFDKPTLNLVAHNPADKFTGLEYYDYPGNYIDGAVGKRIAGWRLQEFQCARRVVEMTGQVRHLLPGFRFTLIEHPVETLNQEYLVTALYHRAAQPADADPTRPGEQGLDYSVEIRAIPSSVQYRAPRGTPRPIVHGSQTAVVVGPSGEEIHTDKYGRVKVQFHWDLLGQKNEKSTCFIRVSQGWAGAGYGLVALPRVGHEVIVDFLEGDPDKPLITGRVHNGEHLPPYLPDEPTKSTWKSLSSPGGGGFNEIRYEDKKDKEQIFVHAQKDMDRRVLNDDKEWIGHDQHRIVKNDLYDEIGKDSHFKIVGDEKGEVGGNANLKVTGDRLEKVEGNQSLTVAKDSFAKITGESHLEVGKKLMAKVTQDGNWKYDANLNTEVGSKLSIKAADYHAQMSAAVAIEGNDVHIKAKGALVLEGTSGVTVKVGGSFVLIESAGVSIVGAQVKINSGGSAGSGAGVSATSAAANSPPTDPEAPTAPKEAVDAEPGEKKQPQAEPVEFPALTPQATTLKTAHETGAPFCEKCEQQQQQEGGGPGGASGGNVNTSADANAPDMVTA
ncbi:Phage-related baseplate assembly protein [Phycisphaerae bacterium RAS1]|nr:Phage-related baseplate assembly protein [Phycisphaerae bacterium RAS1]